VTAAVAAEDNERWASVFSPHLPSCFEHVESAPTDALRESMSRPNACRQAAKGTTMTTDHRAVGGLRLPQLIPRLLLRGNVSHHPAVLEEAERRNREFQLRLADRITTFAGSMNFVWIQAAIFAVWMLRLEKSPWPTLTLVVSLEAIFLSTFVMIGQNRQSTFQQAKADHDFESQELELQTNTELTRQIHLLTTELHRRHVPQSASDSSALAPATSDADAPRDGTTTLTSRPPERYWPSSTDGCYHGAALAAPSARALAFVTILSTASSTDSERQRYSVRRRIGAHCFAISVRRDG
jgi:uncharacterized membrane protein